MRLAGLRSRCRIPRWCAASHAVTDLEPDHDGFVLRQTADAAKQRGQVFAFDIFHRQEVLPVYFADIEQPADVWMRDFPGEPDISLSRS